MVAPSFIPSRVLVGPTAAGKTDVVHEIASRLGSGIVSADAMMVYRGMNIGTAKPSFDEQRRYTYTGLDLVEPNQPFSAHDYLNAVNLSVSSSTHADDWLVAGGTGLYVSGLLKGLDPSPGIDDSLREEAEAILAEQGFDALKAWCKARISTIEASLPAGDRANPRRWIRAVERGDRPERGKREIPGHVRIAGLTRTKPELEERIVRRVRSMYDHGLLDELHELRGKHGKLSDTAAMAIGYAEAAGVLDGILTVEEAMTRTAIRTRQYAKRQMTWFRNQFNTHWIEISSSDSTAMIARRVEEYWNGKNG